MKRIYDKEIVNYYIKKTSFRKYFEQDFVKYAELLFFDKNEYLIKEGEESPYLLFMVKGRVVYSSISEAGNTIIFGSTKSFKVFGEASSIWNEIPENSVKALEPTYCLAISLNNYRDLLLNDTHFLRHICKILSDRLKNANKSYAFYLSTNAENRLASFILQNQKNNVFDNSLVSTSEVIGVSYRHLQRVICSFCEKGILKKEKRRYIILDKEKLNGYINSTFVYYD